MENAEYARHMSEVMRVATREVQQLTQGMWNPLFCSADADIRAVDELQRQIEWIRKRASARSGE